MRWVAAFLVLCACGRVAFDARLGDGGATSDTAPSDAADAPGTADATDAAMADITSGLVAHYALDEAIFPGTANDSVNNLDGLCVMGSSCPAGTTGRVGVGAAIFNGSTQRLRAGYNALFGNTTFTIAVWAFPTSSSNSRSILSRAHGASATANTWQLELPSNLTFRFKIRSASLADDEVVATAVLNQWQHVAGTWDGATIRIYVNGAEMASSPVTDIVFDTNDVLIGADDNGGNEGGFFEGSIDDVRIYTRALTPAQIAALASL